MTSLGARMAAIRARYESVDLSNIIHPTEGNTTTMAADETNTTEDEAPTFASVYAECRDDIEKLDLLAFAVEELGADPQSAKEWKDNQRKVTSGPGKPASLEELRKRPGIGSMEEARAFAEREGWDLPEVEDNGTVEDQLGAALPEGSDPPEDDEPADEQAEWDALEPHEQGAILALDDEDRRGLAELKAATA